MENLYLYGSGNRCKALLNELKQTDIKILGIIDSNPEKWGTLCEGIYICSPDILENVSKGTNICVTFFSPYKENSIWIYLTEKYGIEKKNIFSFQDILIYIYNNLSLVELNSKPTFNSENKFFFDGSWGIGLGGVEEWLKDVVIGFSEKKADNVYFLSPKYYNNMPFNIEKRISELYCPDTQVFSRTNVEKGIEKIRDNLPCTVVFSRVNELMLSAYLLKKKYPDKIKIIMAVHGSCDGMYKDILSFREVIDKYVCVSTAIRETIVSNGIEERKVFLMTCPVTVPLIINRTYSLSHNIPIRIGYAGRIEVFQKRMDIFLKVIEELEKRKVNYCMNIVGNGSFFDNIRDFIHEKNINNKIRLLGNIPREDILGFWQHQDIAINTSDFEGRPISNMEAMVNGVVPVVTDNDGMFDDVQNNVNGIIVPMGDYVLMADRIEYLEKNRETIKILGEQARKDMSAKVSMDKHIELWEEVLELN